MLENIIESYCMKCKKKVIAVNTREEKTTRGLRILKGFCPHCNTKTSRMMGK